MRKILLMITVLCFAFGAKAAFVEGLEDFPIPEGLEQIENANLNFGNEEIRLIEAYMTSNSLNFEQIKKFYKETLPQLGWKLNKESTKELIFERPKENVTIAKESTNPLVVNLILKSKK